LPDYGEAWIKPDWVITAKARLGYLVSPETLFYAALGGFVAHAKYGYEYDFGGGSDGEEFDDTLYGWVFAGIGAETHISSNWRFRYEYLMGFLNTLSFDTGGLPLDVTPLSGTARIALIYDFNKNMPQTGYARFGYRPMTWSGVRTGGAFGHTMADTTLDVEDSGFAFSFDGFGGHGVTGGVFIGYDQQIGSRLVAGVEAGYYWSSSKTELVASGVGSAEFSHPSFYNVRGRLGVIANPSTLIYGLVGYVHANAQAAVIDDIGGSYSEQEDFGRDGVEFGGGIEAWVSRNISLKAEYSHAIFSDTFDDLFSDEAALKTHVGTATLGLVLHFNKHAN
jgi:opacity protein-like surface antigen